MIKEIVESFTPRFVKGATVLYIGDNEKKDYIDETTLKKLGIKVNKKGNSWTLFYFIRKKNWVVLVESVTSHGPVDEKRFIELKILLDHINAGLIFVTAFPDKKTLTKYVSQISWETEVWVADNPSHMIHFNGDKFLGPYR